MGLGPNGEGLRTGSHKGAPGVVKDTHQNAHQSQTCTSVQTRRDGPITGRTKQPWRDCCQMRVAGRLDRSDQRRE
jgi:hypothetical protein